MQRLAAVGLRSTIQAASASPAYLLHRFHRDDFKAGFETMKAGSSGKVVLDWT